MLAADRAAHAAGLRVGMPVIKAQALVPDLVVHDADPHADRLELERLAQWALRICSPLAAADPPDGLVIDVTGAAHLHGGEQALLEILVRHLSSQGIEARAALADSWGAAHAFARFLRKGAPQGVNIMAPGEGARRLPDLPVAALRLDPALVESLYVLGFATIGELAAQPRAPLVQRFGPDLVRRLDQAFGRVPEPVDPVRLPDVTEVERAFAEPIATAETMARYTGKLTKHMCDILEIKGLGAKQLDLLFTRVDNRIEAVRVTMARPVRDEKRLTRLLCDRIETVDPGFGIERMRLTATVAEPLQGRQLGMAGDHAADMAGLIDILSNRIGARRVYRHMPVASDVPERSVRRIAPLAGNAGDGSPNWPHEWPRPVRLLRRPEPVFALTQLPDYPPTQITRRGRRHRIVAADGPERIFGEWWRRDEELHAVRDYFRVETEDGQRLWLYRTGDGENPDTGGHRWFLHGMFA